MMLPLALLLAQAQTRSDYLIGRFAPEGDGYACEWPGSAIKFSAKSKKVTVRFKAATADDRWQVDVDGKPTEILKLDPKKTSYTVNLPDEEQHTVSLVRRTETFTGKTIYLGSEGTTPYWPQKSTRRILIVGDSISAGYGVDGTKKEEHYSVETSNAYMTYGWVAARAVHADPTIVAWSGRKMWPDNTMPEIFDYILPNEKAESAVDDPGTGAVLVNLATNDFGKGVPNQTEWCEAYTSFVKKLRTKFPRAHIYLATGSMMTDSWPPKEKHLSTLKGYLDSIVNLLGDSRVHRIDFAPQDEAVDGIGSDYHPNVKTQTKMGLAFAAALSKDLRWK